MQRDHALRDPARLGPLVGAPRERDLALAVRRVGDELLLGVGPKPRRHGLDDRVGRSEDPRPRSEVGVERESFGGRAVGAGELRRELEQVVQGRAAPGVDVLVGVAHRGDRVPVAEHEPHQLGLGDVRVLILVEEHRLEPGPVVGDDLGVALHHVDRPLDLVPEVDHAELALQLAVASGRAGQLEPLLRRLEHALGPGGLQCVEAALEPGGGLGRLDQVVLHLVVELKDLRDERGLVGRRGVLEGDVVEHARAERGALRGGEDARGRLVAGEHAVPLEQTRGEPVVVGDLGLLTLAEFEAGERPAHADPQVVGGLVREGEAEDVAGHRTVVVGLDAAGRRERQVDDARGHHRGLPRAGAGDQDVRLERHRDRSPLLVGGRRAHRRLDLGRDRRQPAHARTSSTGKIGRPSTYNGHSDLNSHQKQLAAGFGR